MKILVAEDEKDLREILVFCIEAFVVSRGGTAAQTFEAATGKEAIQILKDHPDIALVVSDFNMPGGSGGDVLQALRAMGSKAPFVLCSSDSPKQHRALEGRIAGYIQKPFELKTV